MEQAQRSDQLLKLEDDFFKKLRIEAKSTNTLKNYKTDLDCFNNYLLEVQEGLKLQNVNLVTIQNYGHYLDKKYSSDNSKRRRIQTLRIFFDFLVNQKIYTENPVRKLVSSPKFLDKPRPTPLPHLITLWGHLCEQAKSPELLVALIGQRNKLLFLLIYGAGLKVSDISVLKQNHVDGGNSPRVLITPPKRDPYTVPLPPLFTQVYAEYSALLERAKAKSQIEFDDLLFNANPYRILSGGLSPRGIETIFEELRKKLNIVLTPKSLRQACIFKWLHQGLEETLIKEWMGVAPSYSLKLYKELMQDNPFHESFLVEAKETVQ